jgi:hypothetical protein
MLLFISATIQGAKASSLYESSEMVNLEEDK